MRLTHMLKEYTATRELVRPQYAKIVRPLLNRLDEVLAPVRAASPLLFCCPPSLSCEALCVLSCPLGTNLLLLLFRRDWSP